MIIKRSVQEETALEKAIDDAIRWLDPNSDDYLKSIEALERLYKLKEASAPKPLSRDTIAIVVGNLIGIVLILKYEQLNVVTSAAKNFVLKIR